MPEEENLRRALGDVAHILRHRREQHMEAARIRVQEWMRDLGHRLVEVGGRRENDQIEEGDEMRREEARRVTKEMIREAQNLTELDESDPSFSRYSRSCAVCASENPRQRAVYTHCGHIICYSCAVYNARSDATGGNCVFCRSESGFVKLFEEECGHEDTPGFNLFEEERRKSKKNDIIDENRSIMGRVIDCGKSLGGRIYSLLFYSFSWNLVKGATRTELGVRMRAPANPIILSKILGAHIVVLAILALVLYFK